MTRALPLTGDCTVSGLFSTSFLSRSAWFEKIMGKSVVGNSYHPESISEAKALLCQTAAHEACLHPYQVTDLSYFEKPAEEEEAPRKVL